MKTFIKEMELEHLDDVEEIEKNAFSAPWPKSLFFQEMTLNYGQHFVSVLSHGISEKVVGYICGWTVLDQCTINKIACHIECRREGIGSVLLLHFLNEVSQKGPRTFSLEVRASNAVAQSFYRKFGFQQIAIRRGYYTDPKEDAIIMELNHFNQL